MRITRVSTLTGKTHTREIDCTSWQLKKWEEGALIQNAMPRVSAEDREFVISGITPEEWAQSVGTFALAEREVVIVICPSCGSEDEIFSDAAMPKCDDCDVRFCLKPDDPTFGDDE